MDKIQELIENYIVNNFKNPTTLIVEKNEFDKWLSEMLSLTNIKSFSPGNNVTIYGYNLRLIFATNLNDKEVIVL